MTEVTQRAHHIKLNPARNQCPEPECERCDVMTHDSAVDQAAAVCRRMDVEFDS